MFTVSSPLPTGPILTADGYARKARLKIVWLIVAGVFLSLFVGLIYGDTTIDSPLPFVLLTVVITPILFWKLPRVALFGTFAMACLVEMVPTQMPDAVTDRIPIFWNINTIFQVYAHANVKALPITLFEFLLIVSGICSLAQNVFTQRASIKGGPLFRVILGYLIFVFIALLVGEASGGDYRVAIQECRAQFYFGIVYLMVTNLITERKHVDTFVWMTAITLAIKGFIYTFRRYITLAGLPLPDQGVGSHEEAYFFDGFFLLLMLSMLCGVYPKLRNFMLLTLPLVILGNLATNRRAGTAAFAVLIPVIFVAAYQGLPQRRKMAAIIGITMLVGFSIYYQVFKESGSILALPARSIKSQFAPDDRDRSSNAYRDAENMDQMATIKSAPLGYGYGKHFIHAVPIVDISKAYAWWDLIPHNQILWIWMRTGTLGFFAFWVMISTSIIYCGIVFRDTTVPLELRMLTLFAIMMIGCQLIFGMLDVQMTNYRDMMFTATWIGIATRAKPIALAEAKKREQDALKASTS